MPRFFFDFREGYECSSDLGGNEFADANEAFREGNKAAGEMWGGLMARGVDPRRCVFEVRDENRVLLFLLPFRDVLEHCRGDPPPSPFSETVRESVANICYARRVTDELRRELEATRSSLKEAIALIATPL